MLLERTNLQATASRPANPLPRPAQKQVRLSDAQQEQLVRRYQAVAFKKELARAYGIHVETVRAIIRRSERS